MKITHQRLENSHRKLQRLGRQHLRHRPYIIPILGLVFGLLIVTAVALTHDSQALKPSDSHVVFLFDKGKRQTVDTKAQTVGDLVDRLPLHLVKQDVVEPSSDTPIVEDNFRINIYRARPVTVVDSGNKTVTLTAQRSPRVAAQNAGLIVYPEDKVNFAPGDLKHNILGEQVEVDRATPIFFNLYGTALTVRTRAKTVADLLAEKQIKLVSGDSVQPAAETPVSPNLQVFVMRSGTKIVTTEEAIPAPIQVVQDASLSFGTTVVRQPGAAGKRVVTYQIQMQNNQEVGRTLIQQAIVQDPVPQVVARGTTVSITGSHDSWMAAAGISSGNYGYVNYIISRESNWNPASLNGSGCAGLGQACPGSKLAAACPGWQNNPVCQLGYFSGYASKYGGWGGAYNFWLSHGWW
jgi:resuscitation-promoting factor RpfB